MSPSSVSMTRVTRHRAGADVADLEGVGDVVAHLRERIGRLRDRDVSRRALTVTLSVAVSVMSFGNPTGL